MPASAQRSTGSTPSSIIAGSSGSFAIQIKVRTHHTFSLYVFLFCFLSSFLFFVLNSQDVCGNRIKIGGEASQVAATVSADFSSSFINSPPATFAATVTDNQDGTYQIGYTTTTSFLYKVAVTFGGVAISNSPYSLIVGPGKSWKTPKRP